MMKSMKLQKSIRHSNTGFRHSNIITFNTTSLARRALLLFSILSMGVGNVWGATITPKTPSSTTNEGDMIISSSYVVTLTGTEIMNMFGYSSEPGYLRIYATDGTNNVQITNVDAQYRTYIDCGTNGWINAINSNATGTWMTYLKVTVPSTAKKLYLCSSSSYATNSDDNYTEPDNITAHYFNLITEAEATFTPATESLTETRVDIPYTTSAVSLDLFTDYMSTIETALGNQYLYNFYCRWYLRNASTKAVVDMTSTTFGNYTADGFSYAGGNIGSDIGLIWKSNDLTYDKRLSQGATWSKNDAIRQAVLKNVTWQSPNIDYEVVCVMSATEPTMAGSKVWKEPTLQAKYIFHMDAPDVFESSLKTGGKKGLYLKDHDNTETDAVAIDFSMALTELGSTPKYARFILKKNGEVVDPTGLLTISGATPAAQTTSKPKQGFYLYNSGNALSTSGMTVTLNAADYTDYQVVCMLSTDEATSTGNEVTTEPEWDLEYTYTFEKVETIPFANLGDAYLRLNKHSEALSYFGKTEDEMKDSWYGRWSVRNKDTGTTQPLAIGASQADAVWSVYASVNSSYEDGGYLGDAISGNYVANNSGTELLYGATSADRAHRSIGYLQVYAPTEFSTMQGASDYEIVYEVTDEYTSGTPEFKLRYVFKIPAFENEPNAGMTEADKLQTISNRSAASFTLGDMPTDAKYARFYLMDKDDNIIAPSTILSVTSGTACGKAESGIYLYNSGSVLTPTVTIAAPNAYKLYKVVGLFSTALDDINASGTTVNHEPKWDMKYTYTFDYTITTNNQEPQVEWDATAMEADATDTDIDANWKTSLAELAAGQTIKWWVKDGSDAVQPLAIGTSRQDGTWTIGLPTGFAVASDVATLSGMTTIDAGQLESWVKTNVYAPSDKTYADVHDYKIVCEVYTNNAGTGNPNARYIFSIHKGFVGSLKSTGSDVTERVLLQTSDVSKEISVTLPTGTKYLRAYLTNANGTAVDPTDKLLITGEKTILSTVDGYDATLGTYLYNSTGLTSPATVTLTLTNAKLDEYNVVVLTSGDAAVVDGSDNVTSEPDWDSKTTYWFKYPAKTSTSLEKNVEWSAQSMQITAPNIEATENLGTGYLEKNKKHYTLQWSVVDKDGNAQPLYQGSSRVNDYWSVAISGSPFTLSADSKVLTVTNDANLSTSTWTSWTSPVFYAPANKTMKQITDDGIVFVCKFYEDDNAAALNDALLSMTYTVYIDRTEKLGKLKDGGKRGGETIETITSGQTVATISLKDASDAFLSEMTTAPTYARIYLTKSDGTLIDPTDGTEKLTNISGAYPFTTATYGYYLQDESGLTLPDATLTLPANKFNYYYVVVAMSKDTGETGHTGAFARELTNRGASIESIYEPDYDFIYTIKFKETSTFPGTWIGDAGFKHAKEILVENESVEKVTMPLSESINKIKNEYGVSDFATLAANLHVRWYVTKKNSDGEYEKIPESEGYLAATNAGNGHQSETDQGLYWNAVTSGKTAGSGDAANLLNVDFTKPTEGSWEDYRVMVVMKYAPGGLSTTSQTDDGDSPKKLTHEPDGLDMQYIYNFFIEDDDNFQFVHANGESNRPYLTHSDDGRLNATVQQYSWDNTTGTKAAESGDLRQGVHTVEYDIYVDPTSNTPVSLKLPFQNYFGSGNNLEPAAYIRWYDWETDINNNRLDDIGTYLENKTENNKGATVSRGYFFLNNSKGGISPTHDLVGVTFDPKGLTGLTTIACDVSKYYDGIYSCNTKMDTRDGFTSYKKPYLMHEPTLSTRYIFNIRPASEIATSIQIGKDKLEAGGADMFQLAEDNGRVAVAMNGTATTFSIRANLPELDYYYINNGSALLNCSKIAWYAYYEDETGIYSNNTKLTLFSSSEENRISRIQVSALDGTYNHITTSATKTVTAAAGQRFHLVGYIGNGTVMAPVVHYEINLQDAPAYAADELPLERTEAYLRQHMTLQATVDFDGICGLPLSSNALTQATNHSVTPMDWSSAQYGFCYPDVRRIQAGGGNDYMGISPLHGDYMLLRSMNLAGVSPSENQLDYYYHWWSSNLLYDYTHDYGLEHKGEYGSFLYVDASDESRTIAKMSFDANLCAGSELCFTGFIANMTGGTVQPQVMSTLYAVAPNGTRTRVVSFHSANLSTSVKSTYTTGTWYQVYGRIAIPASVDLTNVDHYEVDIDNYAPGTEGADYAVDQLQFYTSNAKLKVKQQDVNCGDESVKINIYIDAEAVQSKVGSNIYWRICDKDGNPLSADKELYEDGNTTLTYGTTAVSTSGTIPTETDFNATTPNSGYFIGTDGNTYFSLASKGFNLEQGEQYYVSVYSLGETEVTDEALWGKNTDACDIYSPIFVPKMMYLEMQDAENNVVTSVDGDCSTGAANVNLKVVLNMPDADEISGFKEYDAVPFDFFLGDKSTYTTYEKSSVLLSNALEDFRTSYPSATTIPTEYSTAKADNAAVIQQAVGAGLLFLDASPTFNHSISSANNTLLALPVVKVVNNGTSDFHICSPLEYVFTINTTGNGPTLTLGFEDVTGYPDAIRVVRVGLKQLKNMQDGSFILHIPVHTFKVNDSATEKNGELKITGDLDLLKYQGGTDQTTDSKVSVDVDKVATFEGTTINSSNMYIAVNFHGTGVTKPTFYEGFAYRMFFQVRDASDASACEGNVEFLLKVVPEFVTWQGGSAAWNSDANWKRSERAELYKGEVTDAATANNQATAGHPNGYKNNSEISVSTTPSTFVPMKFTYVTIPSDLRAPNLVNLAYDGTTKVYGNMETGATDNIQYDLMVRYTEETCQDHGGSDAVYDCEKFYGNWAKELYMKPNAELLNQQYLTYEKVWVEKELDANTWTLMSTPLQNTYAGDMYVPYNSTDADKNGRQISEAFQPITFSTTANAAGFTYSRTKYPIYQKGWTQQGVFVYTKTNDVRATKYSANIPGGVSLVLDQWSHEYNDVTVPYSTWTAFAIRPHKKDQTAKTLIRLPKADTNYDYYQWDNTSPDDGKLSQTISKETTGKLLTDGTANISGVTYGTVYGTTERHSGTGEFNALVERVQSSPANYQLVGNPYLCSINMATFISENAENLDGAAQGYWTYDNNQTSSAFSNGYIAPMQSFFVKVKDGATGVVFKPSMMVDGHTVVSAPAREFTLMATNERGQSAASISVGEETKSVETLFDSNLADVPVVYTVAEGRAVSINKVEELTKPIAFGVNCNSNDMVEVTFSDIERLTDGEVFVVDAVDGKTQQIYEGDTFTVQPNDYGRYFLTFGGVTSIETTLPTQDGTEGEKVIFDLQGRRVIYPGKGVYIVNGKKVVYK